MVREGGLPQRGATEDAAREQGAAAVVPSVRAAGSPGHTSQCSTGGQCWESGPGTTEGHAHKGF